MPGDRPRRARCVVRCLSKGEGLHDVRLHYAAWILLALEFALAAGLIDTAIAPSWEQIGQLAALAGIRIALGCFLGRGVGEYRELTQQAPVKTRIAQTQA